MCICAGGVASTAAQRDADRRANGAEELQEGLGMWDLEDEAEKRAP